MKHRLRSFFSVLLCLSVLVSLCPPEVLAVEMVTSISTVEEFMAIGEKQTGSYRLEADLDLGTITPLGYNNYIMGFDGALDGNGHRISYRMEYIPGCESYGLFWRLAEGAEITNLHLDAHIGIANPNNDDCRFYIGAVTGYVTSCDFNLTGLTLTGSIWYEDHDNRGDVYVGNAIGQQGGRLHTVKSDMDITVDTTGSDLTIEYGGLTSARMLDERYTSDVSVVNCLMEGSVSLMGEVTYVCSLTNATNSVSVQNIQVTSTCASTISGCRYGSGNYVSGDYSFMPDLSGSDVPSCSISGLVHCRDSMFEGEIRADSPVTDPNGGTCFLRGLESCEYSSFIGEMTLTGGGDWIAGAYDSRYCSVNAICRLEGSADSCFVNGLDSCTYSSFSGNLYHNNVDGLGCYTFGISGSSTNCSFDGTIYSTVETSMFAHQSTGCAANANVSVVCNSDRHGRLIIDPQRSGTNSFSGTAYVYVQSGTFHLVSPVGTGTAVHGATGIAAGNGMGGQDVYRHDPVECADGICGGTCWYLGFIGIDVNASFETSGPGNDDEPDETPIGFALRLTDTDGDAVSGARITLGNTTYITDEAGCIYVENCPDMIAPLTVELKNREGEYIPVLTRAVYYPIPDAVNTLRLEPRLEISLTSLTGDDVPLVGSSGEGLEQTLAGQKINLLKVPVEFELENLCELLKPVTVEYNDVTGYYEIYLGTASKDRTWDGPLISENSNKIRLPGGEWAVSMGGYAEVAVAEDTFAVKLVDSGFSVRGEIESRFVYPIPTLPFIYDTVALTGEADANLTLYNIAKTLLEENKFQIQGEVAASLGLEIAIGVGVRSARIYVEGGLNGALDSEIAFPFAGMEESISLSARAQGFIEMRILALASRFPVLTSGSIPIWPQSLPTSAFSLARAMEEAEYSILPRDYAAIQPTMLDETNTAYMGLDDFCYPYSEVVLHPMADDRYLLVYTDDDLSRAGADRTVLRACIGAEENGTLVWGESVTIEEDGTADFGFDVEVSGTNAAILWQDAAVQFGEGENLTGAEMAAKITLSQTILDCRGTVPSAKDVTVVAPAGSFPYYPVVSYRNNNIRAAWVTSSNADPFVYTGDETETLWLSTNGTEGTLIADTQDMISGVAMISTNLLWITGPEGDMTLHSYVDGQVSDLDSGVIRNLQSNSDVFCYTKDDALYLGHGERAFPSGQGSGYTNPLRLSADGKIYTGQPGTDYSRICAVENGRALPVGEYQGYLSSWDVANGHIVSVVRRGFHEEDETVTGAFVSAPREEIEAVKVGPAVCDNPAAAPGSRTQITVPVYNNGYQTITALASVITADDGTVLYDDSVSCTILPGESQKVIFSFRVPDDFTAQNVSIVIADQTRTIALGGSNLAISADWKAYNAGGVRVNVSNTGIGQASGTVELIDPSGTVLGEQRVTVSENESEQIWFAFEDYYDEKINLTAILSESPAAVYSDDNTAVVAVRPAPARKLLGESELMLMLGECARLPIQVFPAGALMSSVEYKSADSHIAQVDANGMVRGISPGQTIITAVLLDGSEYTVLVTVDGSGMALNICDPFRDLYNRAVVFRDGADFELRVDAASAPSEDLTAWLSQYNANGKMLGIEKLFRTLSGNSVVFSGAVQNDIYKIFLLDGTLRPIAEQAEPLLP